MAYQTILVATDGRRGGDSAVVAARRLAQSWRATLIVVHVNRLMPARGALLPVEVDEPELQRRLDEQVEELRGRGLDVELKVIQSVTANPARLIAKEAEAVGADLIVTGSAAHRRFRGLGTRTLPQRLLDFASCAVLSVPREPDAQLPGLHLVKIA
ncbi:MAG TPA: universal stress protein [Candidatus Binatia bacterium]|nr:universal stress protein [Candidatus Binatia bacterium]